jgi:diguanylate cyclase (GGDEF)-like protein
LLKADELRTSNPEQSLVLLNNIDEAQLKKNEKELHQYLIALNLFINGNVLKANILLNQLAKSSENINIKLRIFGTLLIVYGSSNDWLNALQTVNLLNNYIGTETTLEKDDIDKIKLDILIFYNSVGEYQLAKKMAINLLKTKTTPRYECLASAGLLNSKIKTAIKSIDFKDFEHTIKLCMVLNDPIISQGVNGYLSEYYLALNNPQKAVELLELNITETKTTQFQALIASFYGLLAKSHLALKNNFEAERYAQNIRDTEDQHQYQPSITTAYNVLAEVNEQRKNYEQAFYYYKKYSESNQTELNQHNAKLLAIQKAKLNVIEKNTQIAILDNENTLLKTQVLLDKKSAQNRLLALALLTLALVVFILWAYKNRKTYLKMRYFAQTDELTGIANRHHFAQLASSAIELCRQTNQPISFVIFDLDYFKKINDSYGHLVGDEALKMTVNAAKLACRKNDIIGRLGGEEFGILLPGCGNHLASHIAEKCREAIEKIDTSVSGYHFTLTASFGVSDSSVCGFEFTKLFAGADRALYQSKDLGRNQVFNYQTNSFAFDT